MSHATVLVSAPLLDNIVNDTPGFLALIYKNPGVPPGILAVNNILDVAVTEVLSTTLVPPIRTARPVVSDAVLVIIIFNAAVDTTVAILLIEAVIADNNCCQGTVMQLARSISLLLTIGTLNTIMNPLAQIQRLPLVMTMQRGLSWIIVISMS